ncbi:MAG: molecular chaperone [Candidatus Binatia bacterium]
MDQVTVRDKALVQFRYNYYGLFVRFWSREPAAEFIASLEEGIQDRMEAAATLHPRMGEGWRHIRQFLAQGKPEEAAEEFTELFLSPFGSQVNPYESYYLTGHLFRAPLVVLRGFLERLGLEREQQEFSEPEDVLAFELEVMRWLIGKQMATENEGEETSWLQLQADFLREHLLVWVPTCTEDIERAQQAHFYRGAAIMLRAFLELEHTLFRDWGLDQIVSLAEARKRYGVKPIWKGPTFDVSGD